MRAKATEVLIIGCCLLLSMALASCLGAEDEPELYPYSPDGDEWGYIDREGEFAIEPQYDHAGTSFSEGLAAVRVGGKAGYIDRSGEVVIEPQFFNAGIFSEGLAAVEVDDEWGYIDKEGKFAINPQFDNVWGFSEEGLALVSIDGKRTYIDRGGEFVRKGDEVQ